jgi:hypothetical protein
MIFVFPQIKKLQFFNFLTKATYRYNVIFHQGVNIKKSNFLFRFVYQSKID